MTDTRPAFRSSDTLAALDGRRPHQLISWSALLAGVVLVVAIQLVLSLLGASIGFGTVDVTAGDTPSASAFGTGAGVWWVVSACISLFVGGYVAAWLAGVELRIDGLWHGLVTWALVTLLTVYLLSSAIGGIASGGASALAGLASTLGSGIKSAAAPVAEATGLSPDMMKQRADAFLQTPASSDPATMTPQDAQKQVASDLLVYEKGGPDAAGAKARIIDIIAAQAKIGRPDAQKKFDEADAKLTRARDEAVQAAKTAADATASAAAKTGYAVSIYLALGALAAALGGLVGGAGRRRVVVA